MDRSATGTSKMKYVTKSDGQIIAIEKPVIILTAQNTPKTTQLMMEGRPLQFRAMEKRINAIVWENTDTFRLN
jgi:hypothetical protein